jgi:hypothetical protein
MTMPAAPVEVREEAAHKVTWQLNATALTVIRFAVVLLGWTATETSGTATAAIDVYDEDGHTGKVILPVRLAAGESAESWYGPDGIWWGNAVHLNVTAGQAEGAIFYRHLRG